MADTDMPRWRKIREGLYAVAISDYLQLTQHGLGRAILKIPYQERPCPARYRFGKEWREGQQRWIEIVCE
mgnify:CR=1 FL=1